MRIHNFCIATLFALFTSTNATLGLEKRAQISTDGACSSTITCVGSEFGDCCSEFGFCGSGEAYCGASSGSSGGSSGESSGGSSSGATLKQSTDGTCGNGVTCQGTEFGNCCSQWGYCGSSSDHCGIGCQSGLGTCTSSGASSKAAVAAASQVASASGKSSAAATSKAAVASSKASASLKASASSKPAVSAKASASSKPASGTSTTSSACTVAPTQVVVDPSFEDGSSAWTFSGGASRATNGDDQTWYMSTPSGTHYGQLISSVSNPSSSISQSISQYPGSSGTLSFDWQFMVSSKSRGPPSTKCTLAVTLSSGFMTVASWTRPGTQGGSGHVDTTFAMGIGAGDVTFTFSCSDLAAQFSGGVLIDNVRFSSAC